MTNKLEQDKAIIADAPRGATHYSWETYCKANRDFFYDWNGEEWCAYFVPYGDMRSLADIRESIADKERIADLEEEIKVIPALRSRIEKQQSIIHCLDGVIYE